MQQYEQYKDSGVDWLGQIPAHWEVSKIKYQFYNLDNQRSPVSAEKRERNNPIYKYYGASGIIDTVDNFNLDDTVLLIGEDGANLLLRNLPLIYRATGKIWVNNHAHILKPITNNNYSFMAHLLESIDYTIYITGSAQPKLSQSNLGSIFLPLPPLAEQTAIANFLDTKCEQIDRAVAQKEKVVELLNERRQILIQRAVTRGLNPDVELRDSGIDWIGQIPAHWEVKRLKNLFSYGKGLNITKENLQDTGVPVINYGQVHSKLNLGTGVNENIIKYVSEDYLMSDKKSLVRCNDFIFADTSEDILGVGNCAFIDIETEIFAGYHTIVLKAITDEPKKYLAYLFLTDIWRSQLRSKVTGIKVYSVTKSILNTTTVILPPLAEQTAIAEYLDNVNEKIERAIALKREEIEKLKEYKQTLINSAVTGKIKIA